VLNISKSENLRIISIDPGGTTGYVVAQVDNEVIDLLEYGQLQEFYGLDRIFQTYKPDICIVEDFRLFTQKALSLSGQRLPAPQVIGVVRYLCYVHDIKLVYQTPAEKEWATKDKLSPYRVKGTHAKDALRHLLYYWRWKIIAKSRSHIKLNRKQSRTKTGVDR
jgi:hypothetical protein